MSIAGVRRFGRWRDYLCFLVALLFAPAIWAQDDIATKVNDPTIKVDGASTGGGAEVQKPTDGSAAAPEGGGASALQPGKEEAAHGAVQAGVKKEVEVSKAGGGKYAPPAPTGTKKPVATGSKANEVPAVSDDANLLAMIGLAIALVLALILNIYLLRWRKILAEKAGEASQIVVPEIFWETFERQHTELMAQRAEVENLRKAFNAFGQHQKELSKGQKTFIEEKMQELITNFIALQGPLSAAEDELKRYKNGYDYKIYKSFIERFITKVAMEVEMEVNDPNEDSLAGIQFVLNDLLDEFDIERFEPEVGADYRSADGLADNPKELSAPSAPLAFTISDVLKPGYRLRTPDGSKVIVPARVSVFGAFTEALDSDADIVAEPDGAAVVDAEGLTSKRGESVGMVGQGSLVEQITDDEERQLGSNSEEG